MRDVVFGIDCPVAYSLWAREGPVAAGQIDAGDSLEDRRLCVPALVAAAKAGGFNVVSGIVESPFGEGGEARNPRTLTVYARGVGWIERDVELLLPGCPYLTMDAGAWRADLGFPGGAIKKDVLKKLAIDLAEKAAKETRAPESVMLRGMRKGKRVDTCEAVCISMVAALKQWGWTGAMQCWRERQTFWTG